MNTFIHHVMHTTSSGIARTVGCLLLASALLGGAFADVPDRIGVRGAVPMPGTQQQELGNITFPAPYNVFEFLVTCGACHGGQVDQQVAHFGNWAGTSMASASRDPVFRAREVIVNEHLKQLTGKDGGGNMCFRCHSPNGWYSGRFDPALNGKADGSSMLHSILISTDDEGVPCETCHRALGAVTYQRPDLDLFDPVWRTLADIDDWPHAGGPFVDQAGDPTTAPGHPYGNGTLQIDEGMTYIGRYPGTVDIFFQDLPITDLWGTPGGLYTGQTYGIYPPGWLDEWGNDLSGYPAPGPDGGPVIQLDVPIGPPLNPDGSPNYEAQAVSPEHATVKYPNDLAANGFIQTAEFCGACHEETIPVLGHGMPVQRTYTEWKYSAFGREDRTCQSCHMPRLAHEFSDDIPGSYNADPLLIGGWPYAKPRANTSVHKLAGANRDLAMMMQKLYPEPDFEVVGGGEGANGIWVGTGNDTRIFPGMLTNRDSMWERNRRNAEIMLQDAVTLAIVQPPIHLGGDAWEVKVRVQNNSGHRIPSGYPDGRRFWIDLAVTDALGAPVYRSGYYDQAEARLYNDATRAGLARAQGPVIDARVHNAVMVYERITGSCTDADGDGNPDACTPSFEPLNDHVLFDNRIPPFGFSYADYRQAGVKFWNYATPTFLPYEEVGRYPDGQNWDEVTYRFSGPADPLAVLNVRVEGRWQTHGREFMEYLRAADASAVRPEGPPRVWEVNYPLTPNYLSEEFGLAGVQAQMVTDGWLAAGETLRGNWGGIAYAAWYVTGKGAPYRAAVADTRAAVPAAPANVTVWPQCDPLTGECSGGVTNPDTGVLEPYTQQITWDPVPDADGYLVWIKYGIGGATASWDRLAIVEAPATELVNTALNVNKTYLYKVQAFNGAGQGMASAEVTAKTPWDMPLAAENLQHVTSTATTISMSWYDAADNEDGWIVFRQDAGVVGGFGEIARFPSTTGFGGVSFTDGGGAPGVTWVVGYVPPAPGQCYNYVVEAYNTAGNSGWNVNGPVQMCTGPLPPLGVTATASDPGVAPVTVNVAWTDQAPDERGFIIERAMDKRGHAGVYAEVGRLDIPAAGTGAAVNWTDTTVAEKRTYWYRVAAYNAAGQTLSEAVMVVTPGRIPRAPADLEVVRAKAQVIHLKWRDRSANELGFYLERSTDGGAIWGRIATLPPSTRRYADRPLARRTTYCYRVQAYNDEGISGYSNEICGTTL